MINKKEEKVLKGLKCCRDMRNPPGYRFTGCTDCPYNEDENDCVKNLQDDAISLLEAQKPKLITVQDFENNPEVNRSGSIVAWIEYRRDEGWDEYWEDQPDEWGIIKRNMLGYESMRYWTSRPTDEERKAVKWND